jgi:hypothetical protein
MKSFSKHFKPLVQMELNFVYLWRHTLFPWDEMSLVRASRFWCVVISGLCLWFIFKYHIGTQSWVLQSFATLHSLSRQSQFYAWRYRCWFLFVPLTTWESEDFSTSRASVKWNGGNVCTYLVVVVTMAHGHSKCPELLQLMTWVQCFYFRAKSRHHRAFWNFSWL